MGLVVREPSGRETRFSSLQPSWQGEHFAGHCVLWLPETCRLIDPTVQQFTDIAVLRKGPPVMGRLHITGGLPAGLEILIHRDDTGSFFRRRRHGPGDRRRPGDRPPAPSVPRTWWGRMGKYGPQASTLWLAAGWARARLDLRLFFTGP